MEPNTERKPCSRVHETWDQRDSLAFSLTMILNINGRDTAGECSDRTVRAASCSSKNIVKKSSLFVLSDLQGHPSKGCLPRRSCCPTSTPQCPSTPQPLQESRMCPTPPRARSGSRRTTSSSTWGTCRCCWASSSPPPWACTWSCCASSCWQVSAQHHSSCGDNTVAGNIYESLSHQCVRALVTYYHKLVEGSRLSSVNVWNILKAALRRVCSNRADDAW